jgi:hypothetical protein
VERARYERRRGPWTAAGAVGGGRKEYLASFYSNIDQERLMKVTPALASIDRPRPKHLLTSRG